jgi:hypothetical protein
MTDKRKHVILDSAIGTYGIEHQEDKCIEEMSELTKAILKYRHAENESEKQAIHDNVIEEIADVQITLNQMKIVFGDTQSQEEYKLNRLWARMEAKNEANPI